MSDGIVRAGLGITFSPAGLLTPFHIGVCSALQQRGLLSQGTVLAGTWLISPRYSHRSHRE